MCMAIILVMWPELFESILRCLYMQFEFNLPSGFRDVWKFDGWTTDGQTDAWVTGILLAHPWAFGSDELNSILMFA